MAIIAMAALFPVMAVVAQHRNPELKTPAITVPAGASIASIQDALTTLGNNGGGTLRISAGRYSGRASGSLLSIPSGIKVLCQPGAVIVNSADHSGVLSFAGVSHSGIEGCTLVGSNGVPSQPIDSTSGRVVQITQGSSHITVKNCDISGHEFAGILVDDARLLTIANNRFHDGTNTSSLTTSPLANDFIAWGTMRDSIVFGNRFLSQNDIGIMCGPQTSRSSTCAGNSFSYNEIRGKYLYGIALYGNSGFPTQTVVHNTVSNNRIRDIYSRTAFSPPSNNAGEAVYLVDADDNTVINNEAENTMQGRTGVVLPLGAISVANGTRNVVRSNHVVASGWGCYHVVGNNAAGTSGTLVEGNTCRGAARFGYWNDLSDRSRYIANSARDVGTGGIEGGCFIIARSAFVELSRNSCRGGRDQGFYVDQASSETVLNENISRQNSNAGYVIAGSPVTLVGNIARNNTGPGFVFGADGGTVYASWNDASDDRGLHARQTFGYLERNSSKLLSLSHNTGRGNSVRLWSITSPNVFSLGNQGFPDKHLDAQ